MPKTAIEKEVCENCGVETRENTQFCYNCGTPIALPDAVEPEAEAEAAAASEPVSESEIPTSSNGSVAPTGSNKALEELAERLDAERAHDEEKLAKAAEKRRKARVVRRQPKQYTWEPVTDLSAARVVVFSVLIAIVTLIVVLITIFWK